YPPQRRAAHGDEGALQAAGGTPGRRIWRRSRPPSRHRKDIPAPRTCGRKDCRLSIRAGRLDCRRSVRHGGAVMSVLVLADHDLGALSPATARVINAAAQLGPVDVLVVADDGAAIAQSAATLAGVAKVLTAKGNLLADGLETLLSTLTVRYQYLAASAGSVGKDVMPRLAARLDVMPVTDVVEILGPNSFVRPSYAGNALQPVTDNQARHVLTLRASAFRAAATGNAAPIEAIDNPVVSAARLVASQRTES